MKRDKNSTQNHTPSFAPSKPIRRHNSADGLSSAIYMGNPSKKSCLDDDDDIGDRSVQFVNLHDFSGLEGTECSSAVTKVSLRNFKGLESVSGVFPEHEQQAATHPEVSFTRSRHDKTRRSLFGRLRPIDPEKPEGSMASIRAELKRRLSAPRKSNVSIASVREDAEKPIPYGAAIDADSTDYDDAMVKTVDLSSFTGLEYDVHSHMHSEHLHPQALISVFTANDRRSSAGSKSEAGVLCASSHNPHQDADVAAVEEVTNLKLRMEDLEIASVNSDDLYAALAAKAGSVSSDGSVNVGYEENVLKYDRNPAENEVFAPMSESPDDERLPKAQKISDFLTARYYANKLIDKIKALVNQLPAQSPKLPIKKSSSTLVESRARLACNLNQLLSNAKHMLHLCTANKPSTDMFEWVDQLIRCCNGIADEAAILLSPGNCTLFEGQLLGAKIKEVLTAVERLLSFVEQAKGKTDGDIVFKKMRRGWTCLSATAKQLDSWIVQEQQKFPGIVRTSITPKYGVF